jgi:hypothetical protein
MSNPYLFIVGCPRSGTTLLQRMVNAHPAVAITPESHWIPKFPHKPWTETPEGAITKKLRRRLVAHPKFARLAITAEELRLLAPKREPVSYAGLVSRLFDVYGQRRGKPLVGDKTPDYVRSIEVLHDLWPEARFVHVIRDGRDVAASMREWVKLRPKPGDFVTWREDPVSTAAWWWEQNVRRGRQPRVALGPELYYEVRYEFLVSRPRETGQALADFLNMPFDEAMLHFHKDRSGNDPGLEAKHAGLPITAGLRDWQFEMPAEALERFEAMAGELLNELGYPRAIPRPSPAALKHAVGIRERLANCALTRE